MSIRGPEALASLDEAMRDIRREEDEIAKRLARSAERITKIKESEAELFRQLAQLRLDPALQGEMDGTIIAAESKARDMLKQHGKDLALAEQAVSDSDATIANLTAQRAERLKVYEGYQAELKALAAKKSVVLPTDIGSHKSTIDDLSKLSGADFDKAYVEAMVEDHEEDVDLFDDNTDNSDADIKAFTTKTLPTLKSHLEMIKGIQSKMK